MIRVGIIGDAAVGDLGLFLAGEIEVLLNLMAADIAENAAVLFLLEEPGRAGVGHQPMGPEALHVHHFADFPCVDHLPGQSGGLAMDALAVVAHVLAAGSLDHFLGGVELGHGGEGGLVGEIVLACAHDTEAEGAPLAGDVGAADHVGIRVGQHLLLGEGHLHLGIGLDEIGHLVGIRVVDVFQGAAGLQQSVGHAINMAMIQVGRGKDELAGFYHRGGLALGRVGHAVGCIHFHSGILLISCSCCRS